MSLTVYKFCISPPARLVNMVSEICKTNAKYQEVDLSKMEHMALWFLQVNPARQVPALDENGSFMAQSRDIVKYLIGKYGAADHWYPKDPVRRKEVDEWLDWSNPLHLALESVVIADVFAKPGSNWRASSGFIIALAGSKCSTKDRAHLKRIVDEAESILAKRKISSIEDLNVGDIATMMEITVVMLLPDYDWQNYPYLKNLHSVMNQTPEFKLVQGPFEQFLHEHAKQTNSHPGYGVTDCPCQCFACVTTILKVIRGKLFVRFCRKEAKSCSS